MTKREFTVIIERGEDGELIGTVPELRGCYTQASTLDELLERVKEAVLLCAEDDDQTMSEPGLELVGVHRIVV